MSFSQRLIVLMFVLLQWDLGSWSLVFDRGFLAEKSCLSLLSVCLDRHHIPIHQLADQVKRAYDSTLEYVSVDVMR